MVDMENKRYTREGLPIVSGEALDEVDNLSSLESVLREDLLKRNGLLLSALSSLISERSASNLERYTGACATYFLLHSQIKINGDLSEEKLLVHLPVVSGRVLDKSKENNFETEVFCYSGDYIMRNENSRLWDFFHSDVIFGTPDYYIGCFIVYTLLRDQAIENSKKREG